MSDDVGEMIEEWAERLDNVLHATMIPMPPEIHFRALVETIQRMRDEMRAVLGASSHE